MHNSHPIPLTAFVALWLVLITSMAGAQQEGAHWSDPVCIPITDVDTSVHVLPPWYVKKSGLQPEGRWPDSMLVRWSISEDTGDTTMIRFENWESRMRGVTILVEEVKP